MYTQLGVLTKGTIIEVNVSELGMVTTGGKVVFGKYAQITNNPENDGCINAVLRESSFCLVAEQLQLTIFSQLSNHWYHHYYYLVLNGQFLPTFVAFLFILPSCCTLRPSHT